jgi:hypothetical protein
LTKQQKAAKRKQEKAQKKALKEKALRKKQRKKQDECLDELILLKIRNPYGSDEWTGRYSRYSKHWTPELIAKLGDPKDEDEGVFWMSFADFFDYFAALNIARIQPNAKYTWESVKFPIS